MENTAVHIRSDGIQTQGNRDSVTLPLILIIMPLTGHIMYFFCCIAWT